MDLEYNPDKEEMHDVNLDNERERHLRMVLEGNDVGVDNEKSLLHTKRWSVYVNDKENIVKGGYLFEVFGHDGKTVFW